MNPKTTRLLGLLALLLANLVWGFVAPVARRLKAEEAFSITSLRGLFAAVTMMLILFVGKQLSLKLLFSPVTSLIKRDFRERNLLPLLIALLAAMGPCFFVISLTLAPVALVVAVGGTVPMLVAFLESVFTRKWPSALDVIFAVLATAATFVICLSGLEWSGVLGMCYVSAGAVAWALVLVLLKQVQTTREQHHLFMLGYVILFIATGAVLPWAMPGLKEICFIFLLGGVFLGAPAILFNWGDKQINSSFLNSLLGTLQQPIGVVVGILWLQEIPDNWGALGSVLSFLVVVAYITIAWKKKSIE